VLNLCFLSLKDLRFCDEINGNRHLLVLKYDMETPENSARIYGEAPETESSDEDEVVVEQIQNITPLKIVEKKVGVRLVHVLMSIYVLIDMFLDS
jgi:hypothetical protein